MMKGREKKIHGGNERQMTIFLKSLETFGSNLGLSHYRGKEILSTSPPTRLVWVSLSQISSTCYWKTFSPFFCAFNPLYHAFFPQQWHNPLQRSGCHLCPVLGEQGQVLSALSGVTLHPCLQARDIISTPDGILFQGVAGLPDEFWWGQP